MSNDSGETTRATSERISFLDVLSAVPPFPSHARELWEVRPVERRDRSQSNNNIEEQEKYRIGEWKVNRKLEAQKRDYSSKMNGLEDIT